MALALYVVPHPENTRALKVLIAASFVDVKVDVKTSQHGVENATQYYAQRCSPCMRYPALETPEGNIFESNAILRHIARVGKSDAKLYGTTVMQHSEVDMWLDFAATELDTNCKPFLYEAFMGIPAPANSLASLEEVLTGLELWLEPRTFLVGERMTVADIAVTCSLHWAYRCTGAHGEALAKKYKNAYRLYNTVMQQPKTVEVLKQHGATFGPAKAKKEEKKVEKKAEKKAEKKEDDEEEDEAPKDKKKPNPLDDLPASSFVLDALKREYSNTDTRTVAAPYFFQNYDPAGYTCFWCRYKYNEDNKMQFMTANLVRGWFQRMEHVRKYAFGVALIIGEDKNHDLVAFWVFRGKGMPEIVVDVADTELFDWVEIKDVNAEKEKITDYLCWEGPTIPRAVLEGRCFK